MKKVIISLLAFLSCMANAELPMSNGTYAGVGYAASNHGVDNAEYQSTFTVAENTINAIFTDHENRIANITYTLTPLGEEFYNIDVFLKYQSNIDVVMEWHGKGIGNCHIGVCHFNSEIENLTANIKSLRISDMFALQGDSDLRRKVAVDILSDDPKHTLSYALAEMVTLTTDSME